MLQAATKGSRQGPRAGAYALETASCPVQPEDGLTRSSCRRCTHHVPHDCRGGPRRALIAAPQPLVLQQQRGPAAHTAESERPGGKPTDADPQVAQGSGPPSAHAALCMHPAAHRTLPCPPSADPAPAQPDTEAGSAVLRVGLRPGHLLLAAGLLALRPGARAAVACAGHVSVVPCPCMVQLGREGEGNPQARHTQTMWRRPRRQGGASAGPGPSGRQCGGRALPRPRVPLQLRGLHLHMGGPARTDGVLAAPVQGLGALALPGRVLPSNPAQDGRAAAGAAV